MASYYKVSVSEDSLPLYKGFHLQKVKKFKGSLPRIKYDFSKHVLIELLDNSTPESKLWSELGLSNSKVVVHKRMMIDSHRLQCRRAVVVCTSSTEAKKLAERISQTKIMKRSVCAVVVKDLLSDLCLFEKQIMQFGDNRPQHQFVYVTDLNRRREPSGLAKFLKETFSPFGTILSVLVCSGNDEYAHPEGVIRFAYLSEAFAAELALDQCVVGRERLSVTSHHNILLSQCDLRVRLREAQRNNRADPQFDSYQLNDLSTENSFVNSINSLCISSKMNICVTGDEIIANSLSISNPGEDKNLSCDDAADFLKDGQCDGHSSRFQMQSYKSNASRETVESNSYNDGVSRILTDFRNMADQRSSEVYLNSRTRGECSTLRVLRDESDCESYMSCVPDQNFFTPEDMSLTCVRPDGRNTELEYYSVSSYHRQLDSVHSDSKLQKRTGRRNSKKRKYFTPSQKLCLKSQRVGFSQHAVQNPTSLSCSPQSEKSMNTADSHLPQNANLPLEEPTQSKVSSWLSSQPVSISDFHDTEVSKHKISPTLNQRYAWEHCQSAYSDNSSVENDDPKENVPPDENLTILNTDKFSPLQAWLKQELMFSINNSVTRSQESTKSIIVCAARTRDFIISVGCSHMTCNFCYPDSTDLLLGFS